MTAASGTEWDPSAYHRFRDIRLRPALDLLARIPDLPDGGIVDLGAGSGQVAATLRERFPGRSLTAVDNSPVMLEEAEGTGQYDRLVLQDIDEWQADQRPALIFSNAALHWLPDHRNLFARLAATLAPEGVLAVQMPRQFDSPSHALLRGTATALFPDRFDYGEYRAPVALPSVYADALGGYGPLDIWETEYLQFLPAPATGHPVRHFTGSTAARPILERLSEREAEAFFEAYDAALAPAYPPSPDGRVAFPFRRLFIVLRRRG